MPLFRFSVHISERPHGERQTDRQRQKNTEMKQENDKELGKFIASPKLVGLCSVQFVHPSYKRQGVVYTSFLCPIHIPFYVVPVLCKYLATSFLCPSKQHILPYLSVLGLLFVLYSAVQWNSLSRCRKCISIPAEAVTTEAICLRYRHDWLMNNVV